MHTFGLFVDDLHVYCHLSSGEEHVSLQLFRGCSDSVSRWMSSNQLKLNPSKSELNGYVVAGEILVSFKMTLNYLVISLLQSTLFVTWE